MKEIAILSKGFEPTFELQKLFSKNSSDLIYKDKGIICTYNKEIIDFVKANNNYHSWNRPNVIAAMKGSDNFRYKCGFNGTISVLELDDSKTWNIRWDNTDVPYIQYVVYEIDIADDNYISLITIKED